MEEINPDFRQDDKELDIDYYNNHSAMSAFVNDTFDPDLVAPREDILDPLPTTKRGNLYRVVNTGPKGVIHDYQMAMEVARQKAEKEKEKRHQIMRGMTVGVDNSPQKDLLEVDDEEDEIFRSVREAKLKELMKMSSSERDGQLTEENSPSSLVPKKFGTYKRIAQCQYVDFIDSEASNTTIILHIFQSYLPACLKLDSCLKDLSSRYPYTKFGRILSLDAQSGTGIVFPDEALPTVCVYKNKQLIHNFTRFQDELKAGFDVDDVEHFFLENEILCSQDSMES